LIKEFSIKNTSVKNTSVVNRHEKRSNNNGK
jgi:hypothetical protein